MNVLLCYQFNSLSVNVSLSSRFLSRVVNNICFLATGVCDLTTSINLRDSDERVNL